MMLNREPVASLSLICHRSKAHAQGKAMALKLKEVIRRQQFEVAIQAAIGTKVVARETFIIIFSHFLLIFSAVSAPFART